MSLHDPYQPPQPIIKRNSLHLPNPHSVEQELYINSLAPITACAWGTKAGKTFGSAEWLCREAWRNGGGDTIPYWWVAPIHAQARIATRLMKQFLPNDPNRVKFIKTESRIEILKTNGEIHAAIEFKSADDPDHLQGEGLAAAVVDEADRMKRDSWESFLTTLTRTRARAKVISSPKRRAWFWELCKKGMKLSATDRRRLAAGDTSVSVEGVFYMNCPTRINPYISPEQIERMKSILPERAFKCYYLAEFPESDGIVFTNIDAIFDEAIRFEDNPNPGERYIASLDLAKHGDWTQLVIGSVQRRQIVMIMRWKDMGWEISWRKAMSYAEHFNAADIIIDATTYGDPILESMQAENTPCVVEGFNFTGASKGPLIQGLVLGIEKTDIHIPWEHASRYCKEELECYEFDITEAGNIKYGAPEGQHDDFVTALALWYYHLTHQITPGIRIYHHDPKQDRKEAVISTAGITDEAVSRMLKVEEAKWKAMWEQELRARLNQLMWGSDDGD